MSHRWLITVSVGAHLAIGVGLFASGVWHLERMSPGRQAVSISLPISLPAPSGDAAAPAPRDIPRKPRKDKPKETVQPEPPRPTEEPTTSSGDEPGQGSGDGPGDSPGDGSGDGTPAGACTENCDPPPPPPVCGDRSVDAGEQCDDGNALAGDGCSATCRLEPRTVAPVVLTRLRISGDTQIRPSATTHHQMQRAGAREARAMLRVCVDTGGAVASTALLQSTGYADYDAALVAAVERWRYRPHLVNHSPVAVCGTVTFVYAVP